jgi:hypothetical protein
VPAAAAWAELRDLADDYGYPAAAADTPRTFAARVRRQVPTAAEVSRLAAAYERNAYGPPGSGSAPELEKALRSVRNGLRASAGLARRLRVAVLPPSTLHRWNDAWLRLLTGARRAVPAPPPILGRARARIGGKPPRRRNH